MTLAIPFANSYADLPPRFFTRQGATPVAAPRLLAWNDELADELGLPAASAQERAQVFSGNVVPEGADPLAQVYAGHQFGGFSPQLGDGRALLLGEVIDRHGHRRDIQLKGAGRTPYSRGGDGRAWLGPVLREYVVSEAMHALGVPTTRALAAVATGELVFRESALPGAVLTRVAASHIRVGTFQYFAARQDTEALRALFEHTRARHYPEAADPDDLLDAVIGAQVALVTQWLALGFIHGVMNTDNCTLSGETIDYGPCAFIDAYHPQTVFSSIDRRGRYAYDNQAAIVAWNMAQLASCLVPLCPDEDGAVARFTEMVHAIPARIEADWLKRFGPKVGIAAPREGDRALVTGLLDLMAGDGADFTNTFRALAGGSARDQLTDRAAYEGWHARWQARLEEEDTPEAVMRATNPAFIPRNHRVEQMITAAVAGDFAPFHRLNAVLARPYDDQPEAADLARPPSEAERVTATFCGT